MVDIFSKNDGPRREDVAIKRVIQNNKATIHRLADQISGGQFSRSRAADARAKEEPKPQGLNIHVLGGPAAPAESEPVVRLTLNGRVIIVDDQSSKQIALLGQIRRKNGQNYFALATKENGFFSPVDEETEDLLGDLNGVIIESEEIEKKFVCVIAKRLDL